MLFKPVMARVGIKRDKDGVYPTQLLISKVKGPDYQPKGGFPVRPRRSRPEGRVTPPTSAGPGSSGGGAPWR